MHIAIRYIPRLYYAILLAFALAIALSIDGCAAKKPMPQGWDNQRPKY